MMLPISALQVDVSVEISVCVQLHWCGLGCDIPHANNISGTHQVVECIPCR